MVQPGKMYVKKFGQASLERAYDRNTVDLLTDLSDKRIWIVRKMIEKGATLKEIAETLEFKGLSEVKWFIKRYKIWYDYKAHKGTSHIHSEEDKAHRSEKMKTYLKKNPVHQNSWIDYKRKMKGVEMATDWHEKARKLRAEGMGPSEIAPLFGVSASRVTQVTGERWKEYAANEGKRFKRLMAERDAERARLEAMSPDERAAEKAKLAKEREQKKIEKLKKELGPMADRAFEAYQSHDSNDMRPGVRIVCSVDGCGKVEVFRRHGTIHPVHAAQYFRNKGWIIGAGPRADRCPVHAKTIGSFKAEEIKAHPEKPHAEKSTVLLAPTVEKTEAKPETKPEAKPADMKVFKSFEDAAPKIIEEHKLGEPSRLDRRTINLKLEDVYGDETTGYKGDWTDDKVALELGVPKAWVTEIRDMNFGPNVNAIARAKMVADFEKIVADVKLLSAEVRKAIDASDAANQALDVQIKGWEEKYREFTRLKDQL